MRSSRQARIDQADTCSGGAFLSTRSSQFCVRLSSSSRFGFHNASNIDSLLDKEDVSLEAILDEDELLQECKAQNTRLIDYFQQVDVLQRLLGYVTGQIEGEEKGRFKCVPPYLSLWPSLIRSLLIKIPICLHGSPMQRNMVHSRGMHKQLRAIVDTILGDCSRQVA